MSIHMLLSAIVAVWIYYDAKKKCLVIKNWWWEPDVALGMEELAELEICFIKFMTFLGAKDLKRNRLLYGRKDLQWMKNI